MLTISAPCPRCFQARTTLMLVWSDQHVQGVSVPVARETAFKCSHCLRAVAVTLRAPANLNLGPSGGMSGQSLPDGDVAKYSQISISEIAPKMPRDEAPEFCPEPVAGAFLDGRANLAQSRWTAAAACFRISIDRASKLLWNDHDLGEMPHNLGKRIAQLGTKLDVPAPLIDWLEVVKVVGNDQHEIDDVSKEDAQDASHFAEVFLTYTYTLPTRLTKFKNRRDPDAAPSADGVAIA